MVNGLVVSGAGRMIHQHSTGEDVIMMSGSHAEVRVSTAGAS
jgi:hypothetical protein